VVVIVCGWKKRRRDIGDGKMRKKKDTGKS